LGGRHSEIRTARTEISHPYMKMDSVELEAKAVSMKLAAGLPDFEIWPQIYYGANLTSDSGVTKSPIVFTQANLINIATAIKTLDAKTILRVNIQNTGELTSIQIIDSKSKLGFDMMKQVAIQLQKMGFIGVYEEITDSSPPAYTYDNIVRRANVIATTQAHQ